MSIATGLRHAPLLIALALGSAAPLRAEDPAAALATAETRDFKLTYKTLVPKPAEGSKVIEVWVPVPIETFVQQVKQLTISAPIPYEVTLDTATGNRVIHLRVENPQADIAITWDAVVTRAAEVGQEPGTSDPSFLKGDRLAPVDDTARAHAKELKLDDPKLSAAAKARIIFDYVVSKTEYDKVEPGWGQGDYARVCRVGKGNCSDFAARFITLARASGLPARWVSAIALSEDHASCEGCGYHCYAHYLDGGRWIPVDPSDSRRAAEKHPDKAAWLFGNAERSNVILSVGRDITLVPAQQAGPINFLAGPYVEVDGKPVSIDAKNRGYEFKAL